MNKRELFILSVGIFLTIFAWLIYDIYRIGHSAYIDQEVQPVQVPSFKIDGSVFPTLTQKQP